MPRRMAIVLLLASCLVLLQAGGALGYQLRVRADPQRVQAGEHATSAITVEALDDQGLPVPDHTEVRFLSTLGTIPPTAFTSGGMARAVLSCSSPGTAEVTVMVGGSQAGVLVEFTSDAGPASAASRAMRVEGGWVAYSVERQLVAAADGARFRYRRVTVSAQDLQLEVRSATLFAQREVTIKCGKRELHGERLCYWVNQGRGVILSVRDRTEPIFFQGDSLTEQSTPQATVPNVFNPASTVGTRTWVVARQVTVIPNERLQFSHASVYMDDKHLFSMPYYIASLNSSGELLNQMFNFSSDGGLNLDLPLYYAASENRVGSLHIRRTSANGFVYGAGSNGWSLGLQEQYQFGTGRGELDLDNVTSEARGFRWQHTQELPGDSRADVRMGYYRYSKDRPGTLMGQITHYLPLKGVDLNTVLRGTSYSGRNDWAVESTARYAGRALGKQGITYNLSANLGYGNNLVGYWGMTTAPKSVGTYGVQGMLNFPTVQLGSRTTFTSGIGAETRMFTGGVPARSSADLSLGLRHTLGRIGSASLDYNYSLASGPAFYSMGRQRLDASLYMGTLRKWSFAAFGSYALDDGGVFATIAGDYDLPWDRAKDGSARWRFETQAGYSRYAGWSTNDIRFALGRDIGKYELRLCYSPTGAGYNAYGLFGSGGSGQKIWLELGAAGF